MSESPPPDGFDKRWFSLGRAIDEVLIAGHGQRAWLKPNHPPFEATLAQALAHYGTGPALDLWVICRAIEALRVAWTGKPGEAGQNAAPGVGSSPENAHAPGGVPGVAPQDPPLVEPDEGAPVPLGSVPEAAQPRLGNGDDRPMRVGGAAA